MSRRARVGIDPYDMERAIEANSDAIEDLRTELSDRLARNQAALDRTEAALRALLVRLGWRMNVDAVLALLDAPECQSGNPTHQEES